MWAERLTRVLSGGSLNVETAGTKMIDELGRGTGVWFSHWMAK